MSSGKAGRFLRRMELSLTLTQATAESLCSRLRASQGVIRTVLLMTNGTGLTVPASLGVMQESMGRFVSISMRSSVGWRGIRIKSRSVLNNIRGSEGGYNFSKLSMTCLPHPPYTTTTAEAR